MDGFSIAATCFSLAGGIAKASVVLVDFARDVRDAAQDLDDVLAELRALASVLNPLAQSLTRTTLSSIPEQLVLQVESTLGGCTAVVEQIDENVHKYRRNNIFTRVEWVMFGQGDMRKLRDSLEAYKMALSLGIHAISLTTTQAVKEDTLAIRECAQAIKVNTDDILARVNSIRHSRLPHTHQRVEEWIDDMNVLSLYAETSYQGTVADLADIPSITESLPRLPEEITPPASPETRLGIIEAVAVPRDAENVDPLSRQTSWTTQETNQPALSMHAKILQSKAASFRVITGTLLMYGTQMIMMDPRTIANSLRLTKNICPVHSASQEESWTFSEDEERPGRGWARGRLNKSSSTDNSD
ncbi:hypothetical protein B0T26DRAFT_679312 [Lasiosphaeria miniovina]|uniref:Azaphilone pigments biosynthesis cluster protein L N-terminal domain-containing protein n=1 Tax=Lasiosphaeria miniovina TaxID=1954250 RepID=A0AA40DQX2_9PEZI|nr:uncharacterized protein B0T26DRAFT_679312 [Lasiosphaeria miniovina]KAK0709972.1 hypothetical protein B0T26DRAFT_679312 [Lasiosphaeria miniovina]